MTQAPGSCDKPLARDNKQRQTNPETLPGLAGLQAAWLRRGTGRGGARGLLPAQLLPRHPAGHQRKATAASIPLGSLIPGMLLEGICAPAPAASLQLCPHQRLPGPLRYHGHVPAGQPNSSHQWPTAQPQRIWGWGFKYQTQLPTQEKGLGWLGSATAAPRLQRGHVQVIDSGKLLTGSSAGSSWLAPEEDPGLILLCCCCCKSAGREGASSVPS